MGNGLPGGVNTTNGIVTIEDAVTSTAGGMSGVKDGVNYTATTGYHIRADTFRRFCTWIIVSLSWLIGLF